MKTNKKLIIILIFLILITIPMFLNKSEAFKFYNSGRELNKNDDPYYYMMWTAGKHSDSTINYSRVSSDDFFSFPFNGPMSSWNDFNRDSLNSGRTGTATDYWAAIEYGYRLICVYEKSGDSNISLIDLNYAIYVNPNGDDGNEIYYYKSKRNVSNPNVKYVEKGTNYLSQIAYLAANAPSRQYLEHFIHCNGMNINNQIKNIDNASAQVVNNNSKTFNAFNTDLLKKSEEYRNFLNQFNDDGTEFTVNNTTPSVVDKRKENGNTYNIIGPYNVTFPNSSDINKTEVLTYCNGEEKWNRTCNNKGDWKEVKSGENFYIMINECYDLNNINIFLKNQYRLYGALLLFFSSDEAVQNRMIYKPFYKDVTDSTSLDVPKVTVTLKFFKKEAETLNPLSGAQIIVGAGTNVRAISRNLSASSGQYGYMRICNCNTEYK